MRPSTSCPWPECHVSQSGHERRPYHAYVHALCPKWPRLQPLDDFLNNGFHRNLPLGSPQPRIAVFRMSAQGVILEGQFGEDELATFSMDLVDPLSCRLFLVEDLSPDIVEILGTRFDIDPTFFAGHIWSLNWFSGRSSPATAPLSHSTRREQSFFQFRFQEARPVNGVYDGRHRKVTRVQSWNSNLFRKVLLMNLASTNRPIGFARRQVTIWMAPTNQDSWVGVCPTLLRALTFLGIILLDPKVKFNPSSGLHWQQHEYTPQVHGPLSFSSYSLQGGNKITVSQPHSDSIYDSLVHYYTHHMSSVESAMAMGDCFAAADHVVRIVVAEWLNFSHIMQCDLVNSDFLQESNRFENLSMGLSHIRMWRRRCNKHIEFLEQSMSFCVEGGPWSWTKSNEGKSVRDRRVEDFRELLLIFERLKEQAEIELTNLLGMISVETGKLSVTEAQRIRLLTIAALVFLPQSLVATVLSMNGPFALDAELRWVYWTVAIPLTILVLCAAFYKPNPWAPIPETTSESLPVAEIDGKLPKSGLRYY